MKAKAIQDLSATEKEMLVRFLVTMIGVAKDIGLQRKAVTDGIKRLWDHVDEKKYGLPAKLLEGHRDR